jgi:hypothetical protein
MSTYDFDKVLSDYEHGRITVEMAVGHSLQHIGKLYEAQAAATTDRRTGQTKLDALDKRIDTQQAAIDRLLAFMEKVLRAQKRRNALSPPKAEQP